MRIRTVKPEFWQSESMARCTPEARLLAIALLNFADDEGYFWANEKVIHGALFPFDDSWNVPGMFLELSRNGFLRFGECSGKMVGFVVNFSKHQRVEKPQKSKISPLEIVWSENSWSLPGMFPECSRNVPGVFLESSRWEVEKEREVEREGIKEKEKEKSEDQSFALVQDQPKEDHPSKPKQPRKVFTPPTEQEWNDYCRETWQEWTGCADSWSYYQSVGWMAGKAKISDWKAAARTSHTRSASWGSGNRRQQQSYPQEFPRDSYGPPGETPF